MEIYNKINSKQIEKIQNNMLSFMWYKNNLYRPSHYGYQEILKLLNLKPLKDRLNQLQLIK